MATLPWEGFWPQTNRTEKLSPSQIERILQMHKESKQNAVIYVLVVLVLYLMALAVLIGRYLQQERDAASLLCIGEALQRCTESCCRGRGRSQGAAAKLQERQERQQPPGAARNPLLPAGPDLTKVPRIVKQPPPSEASSETSSPSSSSEEPESKTRAQDTAGELTVSSRDGSVSPAVVRVMLCDLQDTQV